MFNEGTFFKSIIYLKQKYIGDAYRFQSNLKGDKNYPKNLPPYKDDILKAFLGIINI